jgi:hypothetical protein
LTGERSYTMSYSTFTENTDALMMQRRMRRNRCHSRSSRFEDRIVGESPPNG